MKDQQIHRIISLMLEKTHEGKIEWKITPNQNAYESFFMNSAVRIEKSEDIDESDGITYTYFGLYVLDENGLKVDDLVSEMSDDYYLRNQIKAILQKLFDSARSQARGLSKVLDKLIIELENI